MERSAFTLAELIVVIVVLGLCAAMVFPKVPGLLLREPEPWRSARKLLRTAECAQDMAIAGESMLVLRLDVESGSYHVTSQGRDLEPVVSGSAGLRGQLSDDVRLTKADSPGNDPVEGILAIEFGPEGWCQPAVLTITSSDGRAVTILIPEWSGEMELRGEDEVE